MAGFFAAKRARGASVSGSPCGIARGGTAAGKKPGHDGFGRPGAVHRSNTGAGDRPARHSSGPHSANWDSGIERKEGRARYQVRSMRFTDADMEIVPDGSGSIDEPCVVFADIGENGAAWQRTVETPARPTPR